MFPGFNRAKRGSICNGDWDRNGVKNRADCNAMNWKKQDGGEVMKMGIKWKIVERRDGMVLLHNKKEGTIWVLEEEL